MTCRLKKHENKMEGFRGEVVSVRMGKYFGLLSIETI